MANKNTKRNKGKAPRQQTKLREASPSKEALTKCEQTTHPSMACPAQHAPFSPTIIALLLCLLVALSFLPALQAGFVWDDSILTEAKPLHSLSGLWQIWFEPRSLRNVEGHYWPVLYTSFWLEYQLWELNPIGYHIVNLLLHLITTLLLWRLLLRIGVPGAWAVAMIFAVHPVHVESVVWVIGRKDVLAALFAIASALAYLRSVGNHHFRQYSWALLLFVLGMLSKTVTVTLPLAFLIWHWWQWGRLRRDDMIMVLPFLLVAVGIAFADWSYYRGNEIIAFDYSWMERALIAARALWFYVGKLLLPIELAVIYPIWEVNATDLFGWGCLLAAVLVAVLLWYFRHRIGRAPLAGALFFVVTLSPVLGFVDYGFMQFSLVADRYQYLAGIGVIATLVGALTCWLRTLAHAPNSPNSPNYEYKLAALIVIPLIVLGTLTWQQASIYRSSVTYYKHIATVNPQARYAQYNLGKWLAHDGRFQEALAAYRIYLQQHPTNVQVMYKIAAILNKQKRYEEALELVHSAIKIHPKSAQGYLWLGIVLANMNQLDESLENVNQALLLDPNMQDAQDVRKQVLNIKNKNE